jgi:hypothetical protein
MFKPQLSGLQKGLRLILDNDSLKKTSRLQN